MSKVNKMKFDKYLKEFVDDDLIYWYAVNTETNNVLGIKYYPENFNHWQISPACIANTERSTEITKDEFLQAYNQAVEYLIDAMP